MSEQKHSKGLIWFVGIAATILSAVATAAGFYFTMEGRIEKRVAERTSLTIKLAMTEADVESHKQAAQAADKVLHERISKLDSLLDERVDALRLELSKRFEDAVAAEREARKKLGGDVWTMGLDVRRIDREVAVQNAVRSASKSE